jgi:sirohydrochlorin cobaltochelatase
MTAEALILIGHGARDPRWSEPMERVQARLKNALPHVPSLLAFLEIMHPDLQAAVHTLVENGAERIVIVPFFLGQGGHVRRDLAGLIDGLRQTHPSVTIACTTTAGEDDGVLDALAAYCVKALAIAPELP